MEPGENNEDENEVSNRQEEMVVAFVAKSDTAIMKVVETGIQDDRFIEIISGLEPDDEVIVAPYSAVSKKLENKSLLEIVKREDLFKED
jgi:HlyD family secretion protein